MEEETKEQTMMEMIREMKAQQENLINEKKVKAWKLPFSSRVNKSAAKKGYWTIIIIRNNGNLEFIKTLGFDGIVKIDGFPRIASIEYRLNYNGFPVLIIPEWSMKPFSPVEHREETVRDKMNIAGRRLVLASIEGEKIKPKMNGKMIGWIVLIGVVGIGAYYLLSKGGIF